MSKIICPYCSAPFSKEMLNIYNDTYGCETGCPYLRIEIDCESCGKTVYRKGEFGEFSDDEELKELTEEEWEEITKESKSGKINWNL